MPTWLLVLASFLLVAVVLWFMFRMPASGAALFPWAPPLALSSVWLGLAATALAVGLWVLDHADYLVAIALLLIDPAALATGILVLWIYRHEDTPKETVVLQKQQACVGITLALLAVAVGYAFVMIHKAPFTPVGQ